MLGFPHLANAIREDQLKQAATRRAAEKESALRANSRDYHISPESQAALDRGDRQRETGVYEREPVCPHCGASQETIDRE